MTPKRRQRQNRRDSNRPLLHLLTERAERSPDVTPPGRAHTCTVTDHWPAPDCLVCQDEWESLEMHSAPTYLDE